MNPKLQFEVIPGYWYRIVRHPNLEPVSQWMCFGLATKFCWETPDDGNYAFEYRPFEPNESYPK